MITDAYELCAFLCGCVNAGDTSIENLERPRQPEIRLKPCYQFILPFFSFRLFFIRITNYNSLPTDPFFSTWLFFAVVVVVGFVFCFPAKKAVHLLEPRVLLWVAFHRAKQK